MRWLTVVRVAVLTVWAVFLGLHAQRLNAVTPFDGEGIPLTSARMRLDATPSEEWYGIYSKEEKIGWARHRRTPLVDGYLIEDTSTMRLAMLGVPRLVRTNVRAHTNPSFALTRFVFRLRSGSVDFAVSGDVVEDDLEVTLISNTVRQRTFRVPLEEPLVLPQMRNTLLADRTLAPGQQFQYRVIDPTTVEPAAVTLEVGELEDVALDTGSVRAFRVHQRFRGTESTLWIDENGEFVREEGPLGLTLVREARERALDGVTTGGLDLAAISAVRVDRPIASPRTARSLTLAVRGAPDSFQLDAPPRQRLTDGRLLIEREDSTELRPVALPVVLPELATELTATPFLQSDDPTITALAAEIANGETDARTVAKAIVDWVFRNVSKTPSFSIPTAADVARSLEGDCNEHAVLVAALARALGLPARVVAGTVYMPGDGIVPGAFYYHAWNEIWLDGWTSADAVFGQIPADATHVRLLEGGPEKHGELLAVIGRLELDVVETDS